MINVNYEDATKTVVKNIPRVKQGNRVTVNMSKRKCIMLLIFVEWIWYCPRYHHSKHDLQ